MNVIDKDGVFISECESVKKVIIVFFGKKQKVIRS